MNKYFKIAISLAIPQLAGLLGMIATKPKIGTWYSLLEKPSFNPPGWIFGPVWTLLYIMIGVSLFLIWNHKSWFSKTTHRIAITIFAAQMVLNGLWSYFFFGLENISLAFIDIVALWIFIALTIFHFNKISKLAAYLLIPYFLWVSFATLLNYSLLILN